MTRYFSAAFVVALAAFVLVVSSACGNTDSHAQDARVLSTVTILGGAGLHAMDDGVVNDKKLPPTGEATALHMQTAITLTDWPKNLKDPAKKLADLFGKMAASLHGDNPDFKTAADAVHTAHEAWHQFTDLAWDYLMKQAKVGGGADHHD